MDENNSNVRRIKRSNNIKQNGGDKKHDSNGTEFNRFEIYYIRYWEKISNKGNGSIIVRIIS